MLFAQFALYTHEFFRNSLVKNLGEKSNMEKKPAFRAGHDFEHTEKREQPPQSIPSFLLTRRLTFTARERNAPRPLDLPT